MLSVENLEPWEFYLWKQGKLYHRASVIGVGNQQGDYQAFLQLDDGGNLAINVSAKSTAYELLLSSSSFALIVSMRLRFTPKSDSPRREAERT